MRSGHRLANPLLALASIFGTLLAFEAGFRVRAHLQNRGALAPVLDSGVELPEHGRVGLGHMIRWADNPRIVYELKPDLSVVYEGGRVSTNGRGFRGREPPVMAQEAYRIVGIGDSFMFGLGVDDEESYLSVLEAELNRRRRERRWRVINTAVPGYNTVMEVETLKQKGLAFDPDLVIVDFVGNDLSLPNFIRRQQPVLSWKRSFLVELLRQRLSGGLTSSLREELERAGLAPAPKNAAGARGYERDPTRVPPEYRDLVGWDAFVAAMSELERLSREHGFEVISISLQPNRRPLRQRVLEVARGLGFHVLDVGAVYRRYLEQHGFDRMIESPLAVSDEDAHPSALGHRIAADSIRELLLGEVLAPAAARGVSRLD